MNKYTEESFSIRLLLGYSKTCVHTVQSDGDSQKITDLPLTYPELAQEYEKMLNSYKDIIIDSNREHVKKEWLKKLIYYCLELLKEKSHTQFNYEFNAESQKKLFDVMYSHALDMLDIYDKGGLK